MNILWITLESIFPPDSGGRLGVYKRLEQIVKTENVFLFYPYDDKAELKHANTLKNLCKAVYPYYREANKINGIKNIFKYPYTVGSRCIPEMKRDIKRCLFENKIDLINVDFPHMCAVLFDGIDIYCPIILNEHNIEWKIYKKISASQRNLLKKIAYGVDSLRLKKYENKVFSKINFEKITFVSEKDMIEMVGCGVVDKEKCILVPVGADIVNVKQECSNGENILFIGKMSYGPNVEAVTWFVKKIFPLILKKIPKCKFYIVGKDPVDDVKSLASENVIVTGRVDTVSDYYRISDLVVLPLKNGGGVKVKLLEAISYKRPVVSSSIGAEGTLFADGLTIPVIDDPETFSKECIELIKDKKKAKMVCEKAYSIFIKNYTWNIIGKNYQLLLEDVAKRR